MIGYTGPIRCLRLYRTVILPRYILLARGILISTTPFYFFDHNTYAPTQRKILKNKILGIYAQQIAALEVSENIFEFDVDKKL